MPGTTAAGYPYALPDDAPVNWPATSKALADKLETVVPAKIQSGGIMVNATGETTVTFPTPHSAAPKVVAVSASSAAFSVIVVGTITLTTFTVRAFDATGAQKQAYIHWIAVGT